jgi:hypothetical protein
LAVFSPIRNTHINPNKAPPVPGMPNLSSETLERERRLSVTLNPDGFQPGVNASCV